MKQKEEAVAPPIAEVPLSGRIGGVTAAEGTASPRRSPPRAARPTVQALGTLILQADADGVQVRLATVAKAGVTDEIRDRLANCFCLDELE